MLQFFINGKLAVLKANSSFELISENPLFSDADKYTFNISFPLADCRENIEIFGFLNRPGVNFKSEIFNVKIISGLTVITGAGIVTGFDETECKFQFLGNRSKENYYSELDQIFINTLDLGSVPSNYLAADNVPVSTAWAGHAGGMNMVALPWVNESTGNIQNNTSINPDYVNSIGYKIGDDQKWEPPEDAEGVSEYNMRLSWMPYLYDVACYICDAIEFDYDFSAWRASKWYHLLICNAVPHTWNQFWNMLLPHWSVLEFFRKLEPLLEGVFVVNMNDKIIKFTPYASLLNDSGTVIVDKVIDSFSTDAFDDEKQCKLISQQYMGYAAAESKTGKLYSCQWLIRDFCKVGTSSVLSFDNAAGLSETAQNQNWRSYSALGNLYPRRNIYAFYLRDEDRYVTYRVSLNEYYRIIVGAKFTFYRVAHIPALINNLGPRCVPEDRHEAESLDVTLDFVPVVLDETKNRRMIFLSVGEFEDEHSDPIYEDLTTENGITYDVFDSLSMQLLDKGETDGSKAYFSNIAVGFYPGASSCLRNLPKLGNQEEYVPEIMPIVDNLEFDLYWNYWRPQNSDYTLSLADEQGKFNNIPKVNPDVKFDFSFISDVLPDVNSIFIIRGRKFLCEKLTASFSTDGMSQKIKGSFWLILE